MRRIAPLSPVLHPGAERLRVIGVGRRASQSALLELADGDPSLALITGQALDSMSLDSLEADLERLQRINRTRSIVAQRLDLLQFLDDPPV